MTEFSPEVIQAVLHHMNDDHTGDSLTIVRAFLDQYAQSATMVGLDERAGYWEYSSETDPEAVQSSSGEIPWTIEVNERPDIRKAVVFLYRAACEKLGIPFSEH
ncbi:MAG: DUF2470 domain-containing protein [Microbacteriaceae bacterium]|nr:DUF2470 domain-containing protein [Microbacteriaceae bacterium]